MMRRHHTTAGPEECPAYSAGCPQDNSMPAPGAGRPGACQPQPPPTSRRLERGGADHPGRGDQRPAQQDCRRGRRFCYAGARDGEALASPPRSATAARSRRAHAHRVMTAHAVQVAARARRTREGSPSARHSGGNHRWCAASCAGSMWPPPARSAVQRYQVRVRGHPGETQDRPHPARTPRCVGPASLRSGPPT
jgi:hypothetical protein